MNKKEASGFQVWEQNDWNLFLLYLLNCLYQNPEHLRKVKPSRVAPLINGTICCVSIVGQDPRFCDLSGVMLTREKQTFSVG